MKNKFIYILAAISMTLFTTSLRAQDADTSNFNALEYSLQKRYRPADETFVPYSFFHFQAGMEQFIRRETSSFGWGQLVRETMGIRTGKYNSFAIGISVGTNRRNINGARMYRGGLELLHYFDLTSYLGGYRNSRVLSLYTVEGLGYYKTRAHGSNNHAYSLRGGVVFSFNIGGNWNINVEPYANIYSDGLDPKSGWNWRRFDGGYGFTAGLSHRFDYRVPGYYAKRQSFGEWFTDNSFISLAAGAQFLETSNSPVSADFFSTVREHVSLTYGRWLSGPLGLRVSGFFADNAWDGNSGTRQKSFQRGLRGELMFDPIYYVGKTRDHLFSMPLLFGAEAGRFGRSGSEMTMKKWYSGLTGGMQLKLRASRRCSLFLEPRFSIIPYAYSAKFKSTDRRGNANYFDTVANMNFGVEVNL